MLDRPAFGLGLVTIYTLLFIRLVFILESQLIDLPHDNGMILPVILVVGTVFGLY